MTSETDPVSHPPVSLSLTVKDGAAALDFYRRAFGAKEVLRMDAPDGGVGHAEFLLGDTRIYLSEESPDWHAFAMPEGAKASCLFTIGTENCDTAHAKALEAGAVSLSEPEDYFWGMRSSVVLDPFGYRWSLAHLTEQVTPEEVLRRAEELMSGE